MVRLATRKAQSRNARKTLNSTSFMKSKLMTRKKTISKKPIASKKAIAAPLFIASIKKLLMPMQTEFNRFEKQLKDNVKAAKKNKRQLNTELNLQKRFDSLYKNIMKFKTKWFGRLNVLNRYLNKNMQQSVYQLKNQIEELRKGARRNLTILNRYAKSSPLKKGYKKQPLLTPLQAKSFESKFHTIHTNVEKFRNKVQQHIRQLKAC